MEQLHVAILSAGGNEVASFKALPATTTVRELKQLVHDEGGPAPRRQRLLTQSGEDLSNGSAALPEARGLDASTSGELVLTMVNANPPDMNIALKSLGARVEGPNAECGDRKPLLQHDVVFPAEEFGDDLLTLDAAQSHDVFAGIPEGKRTGHELFNQMKSQNPAWNGDCAVSTFLSSDCVKVLLPGDGAKIQAVGFTYSPWDRNYARQCACHAGTDDEVVTLGSVHIPYHTEQGNGAIETVNTLFVVVPPEHRNTVFKWIDLNFVRGEGRRLYFVHVLGALV
mmetsp:Transcript_29588/g.67035  ORF Transcript_29588/g.67035 Transcript_29588/m.67035 type:complete len:283 (-) Transcript_29588:60-908(-)